MILKEEIEQLAQLVRLKLNDAEVTALQKDISAILEYVETVSAVEIPQGSALRDKDEPWLKNVMREDTPRGSDALSGKRGQLLAALPKREGDYALVRKIIEK